MEGKEKTKHRLKGLFSKDKEKKPTQDEADIDSFLYGPSDKLNFPAPTPSSPATPTSPPRLSRLDTNSASRWPTAADVQNLNAPRGRAATTSPTRNKKGLVVRFTSAQPEIIGEGGEQAEDPTITLRHRANTHPPVRIPQNDLAQVPDFRPNPLRRTQTGFESISDVGRGQVDHTPHAGSGTDSHNTNSFAARVKAEMRAGEGMALVQASSDTSRAVDEQVHRAQSQGGEDLSMTHLQLDEVQMNTFRNTIISSPSGLPSQLVPGLTSPGSNSRPSTLNAIDSTAPISRVSSTRSNNTLFESPKQISRSSTLTLQDAAVALGEEALSQFSARIAHLITLFRLSSESIQPFSHYTLSDFVRVASWWFLAGRMTLEATIRDRPAIDAAQDTSLLRQQAYADLGKSYWLIDRVLPQYYDSLSHQHGSGPGISQLLEIQQGIMSNLRKLAMSMKRNNFLPLEDAPLLQGLDPSVWLLDEGNQSLLGSQKEPPPLSISDSMPLGDTSRYYQYARLFGKATLSEDSDSQPYRCTILATLVREPRESALCMVMTNQAGTFKLLIQTDKSRGPTWEDVTWHTKSSVIEIQLPRGFSLHVQCIQHDFRMLWGIYDYEKKVHAGRKSQQNEKLIFESALKAFVYRDIAGTAGFPKEPLLRCQMRVFEKLLVQKTASGARTLHRGFRLNIVTHPSTKTLRGVNQDLPTYLPIRFDFCRGHEDFPGFQIKIEDGRSNYTMIFTFNDGKERLLFHDQLAAGPRGSEQVIAEAKLTSLSFASHLTSAREFLYLRKLAWQDIKIVNCEPDDNGNVSTILSENLRLIIGFGVGSITDRIFADQGELKLRLVVNSMTELNILRNPQEDMTCLLLEAQVPKGIPQELAELLSTVSKGGTTRTYTFPSSKELHLVQAAITGFSVIFDGLALSFNISRRRMVVPIYKKWDAMTTRLQIVKKEGQTQLLAFFENFSHGDCMSFVLKSTDVFESSGKSGKWTLRIIDAKFALPKGGNGEPYDGVDKGYVCLDTPEYPGEHDDITIVFEEESERDRLVKALPAPAKMGSRLGSMRK